MYTFKKNGIFDSDTLQVLTSAAVIKKFVFSRPALVRQVAFDLQVATVSTGSIVITVKKYPATGSSASASTVGTITIPAGTAAGVQYYKAVSAVKFAPGQQLVFEVTTAAAGGGAAGSGICVFDAEESPEVVGNDSLMVASA